MDENSGIGTFGLRVREGMTGKVTSRAINVKRRRPILIKGTQILLPLHRWHDGRELFSYPISFSNLSVDTHLCDPRVQFLARPLEEQNVAPHSIRERLELPESLALNGSGCPPSGAR